MIEKDLCLDSFGVCVVEKAIKFEGVILASWIMIDHPDLTTPTVKINVVGGVGTYLSSNLPKKANTLIR